MYDDFRMAMLRELAVEGLDDDALRRVMAVVDRMGVEYDVSRRCTALVPIEMTSQHILLEYLACKSLEGFSRETLKMSWEFQFHKRSQDSACIFLYFLHFPYCHCRQFDNLSGYL